LQWLKIILLALKAVNAFVTFLGERKLIQAGEDKAIREALEQSNERIERAMEARRRAADPGSDDPFLGG
jgi:hypothetical protein